MDLGGTMGSKGLERNQRGHMGTLEGIMRAKTIQRDLVGSSGSSKEFSEVLKYSNWVYGVL